MRILHIDPDDMDNPLSGGGPIRTYEICRRLARRHEVTVLTPTFPGSTPEKVRDGIRYVRLGRRIRDHGSSHHITFFFSLPAAVRRYRYDLLVEDFMPPASVTFNPLFSRAPVIASVQWFYAEMLSRQYHLPFHIGERHGLRLYRNFVVLSGQMRDLIASRTRGARIEVIPNGITDDNLFSLPITIGDFILYVGRVDLGQKGLDLLFEAYARVPEATRIPLVIAGHGFDAARVAELLHRLNLGSWVRLVGRVDAKGRADLLARCRFVCVPSREETFGLVILEACAAGKRAIVFDRPPMNEVAPSGPCLLVPAFDVDAYARALEVLLHCEAGAMRDQGERCRAWAAHYRWDEIAVRQESFYQSVVEASGSARGQSRDTTPDPRLR